MRAAARELGAAGVEAIAVCFLFSYLDPAHELRAAEILREELPGCFVCTSADITPQFREFERFTTAAMNAFVGPGTGAYLERLEAALRREGVSAEILVMRSNGGVASVAEAAERPVTLMLSGPAAGVLGASWAGALVGRRRLVTFDMGGTSADIAIATEAGVNEASARDTQIAGHPLLTPMFDIADDRGRRRLDRLRRRGRRLPRRPAQRGRRPRAGVLRPRRRGADDHRRASRPRAPRSRALPRRRDDAAARRGRTRPSAALAERLGIGPAEAAEGVLVLANANMAQTIRSITVERGHDPRDFASSPSAARARCTRPSSPRGSAIGEVVIPPHPGITSAAGLLTSDLRYDQMRTVFVVEGAIDGDALDRGFEDLAGTLVERLARDGADPADVRGRAVPGLPLRRPGLRAAHPGGRGARSPRRRSRRFHAAHRDEYGHAFDDPVEIVNLRVTVRGRRPKLERIAVEPGTGAARRRGCPGRDLARRRRASSSCPRRTSTARRSSPASRSRAPPSCCSSTRTVAVPPGWAATATPEGVVLLTHAGGTSR